MLMEIKEIERRVKELNSFDSFNPMQRKALKKGIYSKSVVVCAPTASGKTIIAELCALNCIINNKKKVIYTCPLKAIASEHFREFKRKYSKEFGLRVALSTGDLDSSSRYLSKYDLIFCTNEKIDSLIRHQAEWLRNVGLLIADEIHELDSSRGATLEMVIAKMRSILPKIQVLALSATIPNAKEIAEWLNAKLVESNFRPVELKEGILLEKTIYFPEKKEEQDLPFSEEQLPAVIEDTLAKGKQALFFLNTRRNAEGFAKKAAKIVEKRLLPKEKDYLRGVAQRVESVLESPTEQCKSLASLIQGGVAFHHAGLLPKQRELVEDAFREGKIKILSATTTLSAGVNTPAFRVVIPSLYRYTEYGMQRIPVREYKQMAGRCVSGDTLVFDEGGRPISISEIASEYFDKGESGRKEIKKNLQVLSFNLESHNIEPVRVKAIWKRETRKIVKILTRSGKRISVTPEHPFLVFTKIDCGKARIAKRKDSDRDLFEKAMALRGKLGWGPTKIARFLGVERKERMIQHWFYDGSKPNERVFDWIKAADLKKGRNYCDTDYVSSAVDFHTEDNDANPRNFLPLRQLTKIDDSTFRTRQGHKKCAFPKKWSISLVRFIAKIMADGNIFYNKSDNSYQIRYYNKNREVIEEYARICFSLFGKKPSIKWRRGTFQSTFKSFLVGQFLVNLGIPHGKKSFKLILPRPIFSLKKKLIKAFFKEYVFCDGWKEPDHYFIITSSKELAFDFALLLSKIGCIGRIYKKKPNAFRKSEIWEVGVPKSHFDRGKKFARVDQAHPDLVKEIKTIEKEEPITVYDLSLEKNHAFIANGLIIHNSGRPKYDSSGESIVVARSETEFEELKECYVEGEIECVESQLAHEHFLRMHVLALIATRFVFDSDSMRKFFKRTFYSQQYGDIEEIMGKLEVIVAELQEFGFVEEKHGLLFATVLGKRVSDLYLDPISAKKLVGALQKKLGIFPALFALVNTFEFKPWISVSKKREPELWQALMGLERELPVDVSSEQFFDPALLDKFNSALLLNEWISEKSEQQLMDEFNTKPGVLFSKLRICDWLAYSAIELSKVLALNHNLPVLVEVRKRLKYGVKKELLPLVELRGIGRVRGRRLFRAGIRSIAQVKKASFQDLSRVLGWSVAAKVKEQVGQKVTLQKTNLQHRQVTQKSLPSFE